MQRLVPSTRSSVYGFALLVAVIGGYFIVQPAHTPLEVGVVILVAAIALGEMALMVWKPRKRRRGRSRVTATATATAARRKSGSQVRK